MPANYIFYIETFRDKNLSNEVRFAAVKKLKADKDTAAVPELIEIVKHDGDWWSRVMAADILAEIGDARAAEPLVNRFLMTDPFDSEELSYRKALGKLGDAGFHALVKILRLREFDYRNRVIGDLVDNFKSRAYDPLIEAMNDDSYSVRSVACYYLGIIGDRRALPVLLKNLETPAMRGTAAKALAILDDPEAIAPLQEALKDSTEDDSKIITNALDRLKESQAKSKNATEHPFMFQSGQKASTIAELAQLCRQYPEESIRHLSEGHFESWLAYIGKSDLVLNIKKIPGIVGSKNTDKTKELVEFLFFLDMTN